MPSSFLKTIKTELLPPKELFTWLTYSQLLTKKLQDKVGEVHLTVLKQVWRRTTWWERHVLNLDNAQQLFHREIVISTKNKPCWYARTMIPATTYHTHHAFFSRLEHESLGHLIFSNKDVERLTLDYYAISPDSIEYHWLKLSNQEKLWGRLSVFTINKHYPFYLVEIFLPDFLKVTHELD